MEKTLNCKIFLEIYFSGEMRWIEREKYDYLLGSSAGKK